MCVCVGGGGGGGGGGYVYIVVHNEYRLKGYVYTLYITCLACLPY